ncbi:MAG: glycosyltransferase [Pirellulales bacterium]
MSGSQQAPHRRLSVAMIARDCAEIVAASLESVRNVADEIVVVDTGSRDRTREVALAHASRVLEFEWCDDFASARNVCLGHATGDWILWLDAGETISPDGAEQLRRLVDSETAADRAYLVMVQAPAASHEMADEQIGRIRLHPRRAGIEFTGRVREEIQTAIEALGMSIELAPFVLNRSRREHQPEVKRIKAERNVHLAALEIQEHGVLPSPLLAMAEACVTLGHVAQGIEFFSRALAIAPAGSTAMLEAFYGILAALDQLPQARDKQLALCQQALEVFPLDAQLLCAMGSYLQQQSRLDLACRSFEAAARFGQIDPQTWHLIEIADVATVCHATCQDLLGDVEAARRNLDAALSAKPNSERLRRQLLDLYIRRDCRKEALELVGRMPPQPHREALRSAVRGACLAAKQNWIPALAYLQTAFGSGCRDSICLRGLMTAYLATGDVAAAERTLAEWRQLQPASGEIAHFERELQKMRLDASLPSVAPSPDNEESISLTDRRLRLDVQPEAPAPVAPKTAGRPSVWADVEAPR